MANGENNTDIATTKQLGGKSKDVKTPHHQKTNTKKEILTTQKEIYYEKGFMYHFGIGLYHFRNDWL